MSFFDFSSSSRMRWPRRRIAPSKPPAIMIGISQPLYLFMCAAARAFINSHRPRAKCYGPPGNKNGGKENLSAHRLIGPKTGCSRIMPGSPENVAGAEVNESSISIAELAVFRSSAHYYSSDESGCLPRMSLCASPASARSRCQYTT